MANTLKLGAGKWATGTDTVLAFNDENNNFKPLPFSFSRASSATVVNQSGLIETVGSGEPRIDFLGNTKGALLLEPQRTNVITQSEAFDNSYWTKLGASVVSGFTSPEGLSNAYKLVEDTSTGEHIIYKVSIGYTLGATLSYSFFAKKGERNVIQTFNYVGGGYHNGADFDLLTGIVSNEISGSGKMLKLDNGWYRCEFTALATVGQSATNIAFRTLNASGQNNYTGDGTSGVYIYGASLEIGSYATSYIPTSGSAVTRVAESNVQDLSNVVSLTEGVIYIDTTNLGKDNNSNIISHHSVTDAVYCLKINSSNKIAMGLFASGVNVSINSTSSYPLGARTKIALHYKSGDMSLYINGSLEGTNVASFTLGGGFASALRLIDATTAYNAYPAKSIVKEFKVYNSGLTDAELIALTTI